MAASCGATRRRRGRIFLCHRSPGQTSRPARMRLRTPQRSSAACRVALARRFVAVSPMPRIDGGLELVTSDGELAMRLQRAAHQLVSEFSVRVRGELTAAAAREHSQRSARSRPVRSTCKAARAPAARAPTAGMRCARAAAAARTCGSSSSARRRLSVACCARALAP